MPPLTTTTVTPTGGSTTSQQLNQKPQKQEERSAWWIVWDVIKILIISFAIIIPIRYYVAQPFIVSGDSMQPNFQNSQYLVIDELSYRLHEPARGDVMVFHYPRDTAEYFIKRVIGLPGERVVITNGEVMIYNAANPKGMVLNESAYLPAGTVTTTDVDVTLGAGQYFVLGDNRAASFDSRFWGPVPQNDIVGRVVFRAFPFNEVSTFGHVTYPTAN